MLNKGLIRQGRQTGRASCAVVKVFGQYRMIVLGCMHADREIDGHGH